MALAALNLETNLSGAELRKQQLVEATATSLKKDKRMELQRGDIAVAIDELLDETSVLKAFKEDGHAKTRKLPAGLQELANTANLVTSAVLSGKVQSDMALGLMQDQQTMSMKRTVLNHNLSEFRAVDDVTHRTKMHMQAVKELLDEVVKPKPEKKVKGVTLVGKSEEKLDRDARLLSALENVMTMDMPVVDQWANDVWAQKNISRVKGMQI